MTIRIIRNYPDISYAHHLTGMREGHKCARPHGHNCDIELTIEAKGELVNGLDAECIDIDVKQVLAEIDHHDLNAVAEVPGKDPYGWLNQPTIENLGQWLAWRLEFIRADRYRLKKIRITETKRLAAEIEW